MINNDMNFMLIFVSAFLINNILLIRFIGLCPFFGLSTSVKNSIGMSMAVTFVAVMATIVTWHIYHYLLVPFNVEFLRTGTFILTIASLVQLVEFIIKKFMPALFKAMGIYLPLITTNCAILATTFLNVDYSLSLLKSVVFAIGTAGGFTLAIIVLAALRERLQYAPVPEALKHYPIAFFLASLMSLAFLGFKGLFGL